MEKELVLKLSRRFWDNYKLFLKGELTRKELEKSFEVPDDLIFYRQNCNHRFNYESCLIKQLDKLLDKVVDKMLLALKEASPSKQREILKYIISMCYESAFGIKIHKESKCN